MRNYKLPGLGKGLKFQNIIVTSIKNVDDDASCADRRGTLSHVQSIASILGNASDVWGFYVVKPKYDVKTLNIAASIYYGSLVMIIPPRGAGGRGPQKWHFHRARYVSQWNTLNARYYK